MCWRTPRELMRRRDLELVLLFFFFWNSSVDEYSELRIIVGKRDENDKNVLYYTYSPTPLLVLLKNVSNVCTSTRREFCRKKKKKEGEKKTLCRRRDSKILCQLRAEQFQFSPLFHLSQWYRFNTFPPTFFFSSFLYKIQSSTLKLKFENWESSRITPWTSVVLY